VEDARRHQVQRKLPVLVDDGVARVVARRLARRDRAVARVEVDDATLPLVAPPATDHDDRGHTDSRCCSGPDRKRHQCGPGGCWEKAMGRKPAASYRREAPRSAPAARGAPETAVVLPRLIRLVATLVLAAGAVLAACGD